MRKLLPVLLNQVGGVLLGLIGVRLISTHISPSLYGPYSLLLTLIPLGTMLTHCALLNHVGRYWPRERDSGSGFAYRRFLWLATWRESIKILLILALCGALMAIFRRESYWLFAVIPLTVASLAVVFLGLANYMIITGEQHWQVFVANFLANLLRILLPLLIFIYVAPSMFSLLAGLLIFGVLCVASLSHFFRSTELPGPEKRTQWISELRSYGRPFILTGIGAWLLQSADRWIVEQFYDSERLGLFALASSIGGVVTSIAVAGLMQMYFPRFFRDADLANSPTKWRELAHRSDALTIALVGVTVFGLLALQFAGPLLVGRLIGLKYESALPLVFPAGIAVLTVQVNQFYFLILQGQHNSMGVVKVMLPVALLKVLGSVITASISWSAFLAWLLISAILALVVGRSLVWRFGNIAPARSVAL